jgi:hypothetical protein
MIGSAGDTPTGVTAGFEFGIHHKHAENAPRGPAEQSMLDPQRVR